MFDIKNKKIGESEKEVLMFWENNQIFQKSIKQRKKAKSYSFYDGPPFASGLPHYGHILATTIKDAVTRYWTMRGFKVERRVGWDCHGLPVENLIEKELGVGDKKAIEKMGIAVFNRACRASVFRCVKDFEQTLKRVGRWAEYSKAYATLDNDYMESVWWVFKKLWDNGLVKNDFRITPYCSRCGTGLSNFEVNQGYKDVGEDSVYVKFKIKRAANNFFLVWTTTPWTLPANTALAVNPKLNYVAVKYDNEFFILAENRLSVLNGNYEVIKKYKGKDLADTEYEPLYRFMPLDKKAHYVVTADYVSAKDGSGIVHIAPAFGEEDLKLGKKYNLPFLLTVDKEGKFIKEVEPFAGMFVKQADPLIVANLKERGLLFKTEKITHSYPFCWRCDTPLLYYPLNSWYVGVTKIKRQLVDNNKKIRWVPGHLKEGRFGKWLKEARDWAVSRNRFWGAAIPIWQCEKHGHIEVVGGLEELDKKAVSSGNKYLIVRHGKAVSNHEQFMSCWPESTTKEVHLVPEGIKQVEKTAQKLKKEKIDFVFASDLLRTKQTAQIIADVLRLKVEHDARLREVNFGVLNGRPIEEYKALFAGRLEKFSKAPEGGENHSDIKKRMMEFLLEIDKKHKNKNILIVSHGDPLWILAGAAQGMNNEEIVANYEKIYLANGDYKKLELKNLPFSESGEVDLHRPYIDEIKLACQKCDSRMSRIEEVFDCWFESGSMPYAQWHYPFENKKSVESSFPADFIAEGLDQTRGWFYTLHVLASALTQKNTGLGKNKPAFKNVIVNGLILDEKGQKLSKKLRNYPEPELIFEKYGADALRYFLLASTPIGEDYKFSEKGVQEVYRKLISTVLNTLSFLRLYSGKMKISASKAPTKPKHVLDRWILSRLQSLIEQINKEMEKYELTRASRPLEEFVEDLSNWYVRRSRARFQHPKSRSEYLEAAGTLAFVLAEFAKAAAPFTPFLAEIVYKNLSNEKESAHLENYPEVNKKFIDKKLNELMDLTRKIAALGLKARAAAGIKVRQPLQKLRILNLKLQIEKELIELLKEELNIKEVESVKNLPEGPGWLIETNGRISVALNTELTAELKEEGLIRELVRNIQEMRRDAGLKPQEKIAARYSCSGGLEEIIGKHRDNLKQAISADKLEAGLKEKQVFAAEKTFDLETVPGDTKNIWIGIKKL